MRSVPRDGRDTPAPGAQRPPPLPLAASWGEPPALPQHRRKKEGVITSNDGRLQNFKMCET